MSVKKRNIGLCILWSILTFGIYTLVWEWNIINGLAEDGAPAPLPGIAQYLLTFCYVGYIVFGWAANTEWQNVCAKAGRPAEDNMVLFLILGIVCPFALLAVVQHKYNQLA